MSFLFWIPLPPPPPSTSWSLWWLITTRAWLRFRGFHFRWFNHVFFHYHLVSFTRALFLSSRTISLKNNSPSLFLYIIIIIFVIVNGPPIDQWLLGCIRDLLNIGWMTKQCFETLFLVVFCQIYSHIMFFKNFVVFVVGAKWCEKIIICIVIRYSWKIKGERLWGGEVLIWLSLLFGFLLY